MAVEPIHAYGASISVADVRAALDGVTFDDESPDYALGGLSDGLRGLLERLAVSAGDSRREPREVLAWSAEGIALGPAASDSATRP